MSQPVNIVDPSTGVIAKITSRGELIVAPIQYSTSYATVNTIATTSTVVPAKPDKRFILTSIFIAQDKTNIDTHITLFESDDDSSTTQNKVIFETDFQRNQTMVATGLDIITQPVKWINLTTDQVAVINVTLAGYYIDA